MKSFSNFLEGVQTLQQAITFLHLVTMSSRMGSMPSEEVLALFGETIDPAPVTVYRGLTITNTTPQERELLESLKSGDDAPDQFIRPNGSQVTIHTTKSKEVAARYASGEGSASLVLEFTVQPDAVVVDTTNISRILEAEDLDDPADWEYFVDTQEVLLYRDCLIDAAKVVSVEVK